MLGAIHALVLAQPSGILAELLQGQDTQAAALALFVKRIMSRMGFARDKGVVRCDGSVGTARFLVLSESLGVEGRTVLPLLAVHASDPVGELSIVFRTYWGGVPWEHTVQSCRDCSHWWERYGQQKHFHF